MRALRETVHPPTGHSFRVIQWSRNLRDVEVMLAPGTAEKIRGEGTRWHYHVAMELTLFTAGEGTRFVGDQIESFKAGDLVLLGEKLPHYWHTRGTSAGISVQWHFPEGHALWAFPELLSALSLFKKAGRGVQFTGSTAAHLKEALGGIAQTSEAARLARLLLLFSLMVHAPERDRRLLSHRSFELPSDSLYQESMGRVMRHLIARFREPVRLEEVLKIAGMSRPTFARQFKKHAGHTCSEFLNRLRLQAACRDLTESDSSVLEIAMTSGFTQVSFFNRLFRRHLGCSPSQFRERSRA